MVKSSPEKLAAALRANLKRRKGVTAIGASSSPPDPVPQPAKKPPKN
jgi:hypothetical protein